MSFEPQFLLLSSGLLLGIMVGAVGQMTHFCTMGAISDRVLFGSSRRLHAWTMAMATALIGTQCLHLLADLPLETTVYHQAAPWGLAAPLGGLLFGFGMVLAGGCAYRNLVRTASGSLKGMSVILVMAVTAWATLAGILAPVALTLRRAVLAAELPAGIDGQAAQVFGGGERAWSVVVTLVLVMALLTWSLRRPRSRDTWLVGLTLGAAVIIGFAVTGLVAADPFEPVPVQSLTFVGPSAGLLYYLMTGHGMWPGFAPALTLGVLIGAALSAGYRGEFRIEGFTSSADMTRHLAGAVLMGFGGTVAVGCTIGQGVTGLSTLAFGSFVALAGIVAGAVLALRWLMHGWSLGLNLWPGRMRSGHARPSARP